MKENSIKLIDIVNIKITKKMNKFRTFLAVVAFLGASLGANAQIIVLGSGNCGANGSNLTWTLTSNHVFTIRGSGNMGNYSVASPWGTYKHAIDTLIIGDSVTSIGHSAFASCSNLISITMPNSIIRIENNAFAGCNSLNSIYGAQNNSSISNNINLPDY